MCGPSEAPELQKGPKTSPKTLKERRKLGVAARTPDRTHSSAIRIIATEEGPDATTDDSDNSEEGEKQPVAKPMGGLRVGAEAFAFFKADFSKDMDELFRRFAEM